MFAGDNVNSIFPTALDENGFQFEVNRLHQLQLFGDFPVGCTGDSFDYAGNEPAANLNQAMERIAETKSFSRQQKHLVSLNHKSFQDKAGQSGSILNLNPVSTGLRLSYEEDEHNSSIISASENIKASLPIIESLGGPLKAEMDKQNEDLNRYIRLQGENMAICVRELKQRHTVTFLSAIEKGISKKLREKELEIDNMNRRKKELVERIKQLSMEVQSWQYKAKYNESVIVGLRNNLQQVISQGAVLGKECCGDSEVEELASCTNTNGAGNLDIGNPHGQISRRCRACGSEEICILLFPCRHLCLCRDCEMFIDVCPVCRLIKTASVQVLICHRN